MLLAGAVWANPTRLVDDPTGPLPERLSQTGLLEAEGLEAIIARAHAAPGSRPAGDASRFHLYEPRWPLWSNGSHKIRHVVVPHGRQIDTSDGDDWKFPVGTLFFKTFTFETAQGVRPIETRVIRGLEDGWEFAVYEWEPDGNDAKLLDIGWARPIELPGRDGRTIRHEIPSRLQCRQCHEANTNFIIGFSELNLNAPLSGRSERTQLEELHACGVLSHLATEPARIDDDAYGSASVRGYVHGNCVHCHNGRNRLDLSADVFLANTLSRPTQGMLFPAGQRIRPGEPDESLLYLALARSDQPELAAAHMPPVGVQEPDTAAAEEMRAWITSLASHTLPPPADRDQISPRTARRRIDRAPGLVPNRPASSLQSAHRYPLRFERIVLDGPHAETRGFTTIRFLPGTNLFLLAEHEGGVHLYELVDGRGVHRGAFRIPDVFARIECGLVTLELDPDFATNGYIYAGYCYQDPAHLRIARFRLNLEDLQRTPETLATIIEVDAPGAEPWHTIGNLTFDRHKALLIPLGERGLRAPAQDNASILGSILRVMPNRTDGGAGYTIPPDNPDPSLGWGRQRRGELLAKGLRNPWTISLDRWDRLWIGDVGEKFEEINLIARPGEFQNFGWPHRDGRCADGCEGYVDPVITYTRSGDHLYARQDPGTRPVAEQCVWVGPLYRPSRQDRYGGQLTNALLFGDFVLGWVRGLFFDADGHVIGDRPLANMPGITSWTLGPDDYLYVCTYAAYTQDLAAVFRVVPDTP